jgi:hypothetical protein
MQFSKPQNLEFLYLKKSQNLELIKVVYHMCTRQT